MPTITITLTRTAAACPLFTASLLSHAHFHCCRAIEERACALAHRLFKRDRNMGSTDFLTEDGDAEKIIAEWSADRSFYVRNLFTWAPTPFFNTGFVVDADRTIHPSNIGLSGALDELRAETIVGTLDDPPDAEALKAAAERTNALLKSHLSPRVWESTHAVDRQLSNFCRQLYPHWAAYRKRRRAA